jgi:diguanylate cyclase (GGDEF)-like protein
MSTKALGKTWLLGTDPAQRARAYASLMVLLLYVGYGTVQHCEVLVGLIDSQASWRLTLTNLSVQVGFYFVIRSGLNLRLKRDRSLRGAQSLWAMTGALWGYAITGPARGAVLTVLVVTVLFGVFAARPEKVARLAAICFFGLAGVMLWKVSTDPTYDRRVEAVHLALAGVTLLGSSQLAKRIARLRGNLERKQIELGQALERIQLLATRDELTGLLNRRAVLERLRAELLVRRRPQQPLALALIDIDHFKVVNDSHGHAAGDAVLCRFAERSSSLVRGGDFMARWGGEEFLMVMPATGAEPAMVALQRLRDVLHAESFDDVAPGLVLNFSAGVTECTGPADLEAAIERADQAMYRAKQGGRDRALIALPEKPDTLATPKNAETAVAPLETAYADH